MPKTGVHAPPPFRPASLIYIIQSRDKVGLSLAAKKFRLMMSRIDYENLYCITIIKGSLKVET